MTERRDASYWARVYYDKYGAQNVSLEPLESPQRAMSTWTIMALLGLAVVWWVGFYTIILFILRLFGV